MSKIKVIIVSVFLILNNLTVKAQEAQVQVVSNEPEMAGLMYKDGKIWVVIAVILVILLALIGYLFALDRKIRTIEQEEI